MIPTDLNPALSLGALVAEQPARARLFEQLRLDYCCGGRQSLAEACAKRGLDLDDVQAALQALDTAENSHDIESTDWRTVGLGELCEHIVAVHHDGLRDAFPRIAEQLATVVRVHGAGDPRLHDVQRAFNEIRANLEPHLASEEAELFPACIAWEQQGTPVDERVIAEHEHEHAAVGDALAGLRALCHDYDRTAAHCNTHRALMDALEGFEQDLHRHVHEENNILLLRVREPRARPEATSGERTLPCCEGWIAEQTHNWARRR
jgi:regulator of cell morphogenesis and NO signaling